MNQKVKRVLAVLLIIFTVFAWYITVFGIGKVEPIKDKLNLGLDIKGGVYVVMEVDQDEIADKTEEELTALMDQTKTVMENRVFEMGFSEANVTIEGDDRLRIEIPGAENAQEVIDKIGQTAQLKFILADGTVVVTGDNVKDAQPGTSTNSTGYVINVKFDSEGASLFEEGTKKAISHEVTPTIEGMSSDEIAIVLDNNVVCHPQVKEVIAGGSCEISGNYTQERATEEAALIRGGSLPVTLHEITSSTQTATIGFNALEKSAYAGIIGFILIFVLMLFAYRKLGIVADLALMLYIICVLWAMAFSGSTLTLPGIAGLILGIGMAVDANVIIFSRIREELLEGKSVRNSCTTGFHNALSAILDGQITTLLAGVVLYEIGSATVKGFAITLMLGVIFSILTGVLVSRLYIEVWVNLKQQEPSKAAFGMKKDGTMAFSIKKFIPFLNKRKVYYIISASIIIIGILVGCIRGFNYGIDFTGGTNLQIDMGKQVELQDVEKVMTDNGCKDLQIIYAGEGNKQVIIKTTTFLDNAGREKVFEAMQKEFGCEDNALLSSEQFGPAVGDELKFNALKALLISAIAMLIYIWFRFRKGTFGIAAVAGVTHDVLVVVAFYGLFHVTVNNPFIAGILTVVGYSINDTIVVFDRIRENLGFTKKKELQNLVDSSINQVLGRSIMTSVTTLIVMIPLYIMVSSSIRAFVLPLMVGVIVGCYSSIFLCSPLYYDITKWLEKKRKSTRKNNYKGAPKKEKKIEAPKDYGNGAVV